MKHLRQRLTAAALLAVVASLSALTIGCAVKKTAASPPPKEPASLQISRKLLAVLQVNESVSRELRRQADAGVIPVAVVLDVLPWNRAVANTVSRSITAMNTAKSEPARLAAVSGILDELKIPDKALKQLSDPKVSAITAALFAVINDLTDLIKAAPSPAPTTAPPGAIWFAPGSEVLA